ncbi:MAG: helix-turn-helix domain-containing protein [Anaerolineae bacterium]
MAAQTPPPTHAKPHSVLLMRHGSFVIVPLIVLEKFGSVLGPTGIAVYIALARHTDQNGHCYPSIKRISQVAGCGKDAVKSALQRLMKLNLVARIRSYDPTRSRPYTYQLLPLSPEAYAGDNAPTPRQQQPNMHYTRPFGRFVAVPSEVTDAFVSKKRLRAKELSVYAAVVSCLNPLTGKGEARLETILLRAGYTPNSRRSVRPILATLQEAGLLTVTDRSSEGKPHYYQQHDPRLAPPSQVDTPVKNPPPPPSAPPPEGVKQSPAPTRESHPPQGKNTPRGGGKSHPPPVKSPPQTRSSDLEKLDGEGDSQHQPDAARDVSGGDPPAPQIPDEILGLIRRRVIKNHNRKPGFAAQFVSYIKHQSTSDQKQRIIGSAISSNSKIKERLINQSISTALSSLDHHIHRGKGIFNPPGYAGSAFLRSISAAPEPSRAELLGFDPYMASLTGFEELADLIQAAAHQIAGSNIEQYKLIIDVIACVADDSLTLDAILRLGMSVEDMAAHIQATLADVAGRDPDVVLDRLATSIINLALKPDGEDDTT